MKMMMALTFVALGLVGTVAHAETGNFAADSGRAAHEEMDQNRLKQKVSVSVGVDCNQLQGEAAELVNLAQRSCAANNMRMPDNCINLSNRAAARVKLFKAACNN